ncbi:AbiJ-NTD4 domain-containing protein [Leptospira interrogans]|uniref:AbiJ-NTD4 domain-containing protein n=1 Tax=Leptospira interrogans TaxID=173 RepID=UPI000774184E|nr:hypothetical protein [Leptospira interrogans]MCR8640891.1 hypothetical protein [Leptospira interrogans serovar Ricardi]
MSKKRFSERKGHKKIQEIIQKESISQTSRRSLWNLLFENVWIEIFDPKGSRDVLAVIYPTRHFFQSNGPLDFLLKQIWTEAFDMTVDRVPVSWKVYLDQIKDYFFQLKWYEIYDFIELILESIPDEMNYRLTEQLNSLFNREHIPYSILDSRVTDITSEEELNEVNQATTTRFEVVNVHISTSVNLLYSDSPDYRNSIKESISAVESIVKVITSSPKGTLGDLLKILEKNYPMHPAFKDSLSKLYGYTSDSAGIRHALMEESNLTKEDAKLMLILCSAFVNFIIERVSK